MRAHTCCGPVVVDGANAGAAGTGSSMPSYSGASVGHMLTTTRSKCCSGHSMTHWIAWFLMAAHVLFPPRRLQDHAGDSLELAPTTLVVTVRASEPGSVRKSEDHLRALGYSRVVRLAAQAGHHPGLHAVHARFVPVRVLDSTLRGALLFQGSPYRVIQCRAAVVRERSHSKSGLAYCCQSRIQRRAIGLFVFLGVAAGHAGSTWFRHNSRARCCALEFGQNRWTTRLRRTTSTAVGGMHLRYWMLNALLMDVAVPCFMTPHFSQLYPLAGCTLGWCRCG